MITRFLAIAGALLVGVALLGGLPIGATAGDAPAKALTADEQKDLTIAFQTVELWQLRATNAVSEFEKAKAAAQDLARKLTPAGYQMSQTPAGKFELLKVPDPKANDPKP